MQTGLPGSASGNSTKPCTTSPSLNGPDASVTVAKCSPAQLTSKMTVFRELAVFSSTRANASASGGGLNSFTG